MINEDSIHTHDGIQEGEVNGLVCLFFWILNVFIYRNQIYSVRIPISNETNVLLFSISENSQNYQRGKPKGGPCHCISTLTVSS